MRWNWLWKRVATIDGHVLFKLRVFHEYKPKVKIRQTLPDRHSVGILQYILTANSSSA